MVKSLPSFKEGKTSFAEHMKKKKTALNNDIDMVMPDDPSGYGTYTEAIKKPRGFSQGLPLGPLEDKKSDMGAGEKGYLTTKGKK